MQGDPWARTWRDDPRRDARDREPAREVRDSFPDDYGQADYSRDYAYDPETRTGYRRGAQDDADRRERVLHEEARRDEGRREPRSWFGLRREPERDDRHDRRRLAADRRIWAVIAERLEHDRHVDTSDIDISVEDGVVYLTGTARTREGKRRIEHMADVDGVRDIVNSIRVRELGR